MKQIFAVGEKVLLNNPDTPYKYNGIPRHHWGKEWVIVQVQPDWSRDEAAYYLQIEGNRQHVIHSMLQSTEGPW